MPSKRKNRQHAGKRQRNGAKGTGERNGRLQLNHTRLEPSRFPILPHEFQCALVYKKHDERTGGQTTPANWVQAMCEYDTHLPRFAPELYQIYRQSRIMAIDVRMSVVNTTATEPLLCAIGVLPFVDASVSTLSPQVFADWPRATVFQVGVLNGLSMKSVTRRYVTEKEFGEMTLSGSDYLQTYSEAITGGVKGELPAIYAGVIASRVGATYTAIIQYEFTFHIRFSELNYPSLGGRLRELPPLDQEDDFHYENSAGAHCNRALDTRAPSEYLKKAGRSTALDVSHTSTRSRCDRC